MKVSEQTGRIKVDAKKCSGCRICEQVCVFYHEREFNPKRARIKILIREKEGINAPLICKQCKKCIASCNRDALSWDETMGVVRVDTQKCNACGLCIDTCPEAAIFVDPISGVVNICDLCNGNPRCVKWCPQDVLKYEVA
jgi:carbon-monoxide dehydrogenase iron sulfur subunit